MLFAFPSVSITKTEGSVLLYIPRCFVSLALSRKSLVIHFFFFAKWESSLNNNRNIGKISKPRLFKRGWEIVREIQNWGEP